MGNKYISDTVIQEINSKIEELSKQQKILQKQEMLYEKQQSNMQQYNDSTFRMLWQKMSITQKQEAIRYLVKKVIWNGKEIQIILTENFL